MTAILIDASGYLYRAFFTAPTMQRSDGTPTGLVHGYCRMLWKLKRTYEKAPYFAVVFDKGKSAKRIAIYPEYKAQRKPTHPDMAAQLPLVRRATQAFGLDIVEADGIEADDLIASYAKAYNAAGVKVVVVSSDKDLMQVMGPHVSLYCPLKDRPITTSDVLAKFGCPPSRVPDAQGLIGDTSDNIPGVPSIGEKKAAALMGAFGTLDNVLANADQITQPALRRALETYADQALLSRQLATLDRDVPLPIEVNRLASREVTADALLAFAQEMEFHSFCADLAAHYGLEVAA